MSKIAIIIILFIFSIKVDHATAQMQSSTYILDTEAKPEKNVKSKSQPFQKSNSPSTIIKGNGFRAILGINTNESPQPFEFSLSDSSLNFGEVKPGDPLLRTQLITVNPGSANGFEVSAFESHPLRSSNKQEIPNTSCDSGNCTNTLFDAWESPLTYGFGYRCENVEGSACLAGINNLLYKRFSNQEADELPTLLLSSSLDTPTKSLLEYKINIPGNQPLEAYKTTIHLIASPSL